MHKDKYQTRDDKYKAMGLRRLMAWVPVEQHAEFQAAANAAKNKLIREVKKREKAVKNE